MPEFKNMQVPKVQSRNSKSLYLGIKNLSRNTHSLSSLRNPSLSYKKKKEIKDSNISIRNLKIAYKI